jgi:hypothetical protein
LPFLGIIQLPATTTESTTNVETLKKPKEAQAQEKSIERQKENKNRLPCKALEEQYNRERTEAIDALYDEIANSSDLEAEKADFVYKKLLGIKALYDLYQQECFENVGIRASFKYFLAEKYLKPEYRRFESWCDKFHPEQKV